MFCATDSSAWFTGRTSAGRTLQRIWARLSRSPETPPSAAGRRSPPRSRTRRSACCSRASAGCRGRFVLGRRSGWVAADHPRQRLDESVPVCADGCTEEVFGEVMAHEGEHRDRGHSIGIRLCDLSPLHPLGEERALGLGPVLGQDALQRFEQPGRCRPPGRRSRSAAAGARARRGSCGRRRRAARARRAAPRGGCGPSDLAFDDGGEHRFLVLEVPVEAATPRRQAGSLLDLDDGRAGDTLPANSSNDRSMIRSRVSFGTNAR